MTVARSRWRQIRYRRPIVIGLQLAVSAASFYTALWLRFEGELSTAQAAALVQLLPWLLVLRGVAFLVFRLYEGLWRYASIRDLLHIAAAVATSSIAFELSLRWMVGSGGYPRAVLMIDAMLLVLLLGAMRLGRRLHREFVRPRREKRVLIYGAGDAGEMIARDMRNNAYYEYEPVGFVDDDATKVGLRVHGVKVLGTRAALPQVMAATQPDAVLVAIARAEPSTIRDIVRALEGFKVPIQRLPNLRDLIDGRVSVSQIRTLSIEDLLERAPVALGGASVHELIAGRRILVTGAGGFIGAELSRQILTLAPDKLILLDRYENGLFETLTNIENSAPSCPVEGLVVDVTDKGRLRAVMAAGRPDIVFHAAAHKHVPLMEMNPCEAVLNNVRGVRLMIEAAREMDRCRLVLISSDKAVNPASVMGATKRVAEMLIQASSRPGRGPLTAVRFGNVLGSHGSVVPQFVEQIKRGGPVTITHPEMRRFFMVVSEAVGLVLHAASLARGGDIFVLTMGEQVRVLDLARNLIRLTGLVPDEDIPFRIIGVRPGEKLSEELVGADEEVEHSPVPGIMRIHPRQVREINILVDEILEAECLAEDGDVRAVIKHLQMMVPTYQPAVDNGRG